MIQGSQRVSIWVLNQINPALFIGSALCVGTRGVLENRLDYDPEPPGHAVHQRRLPGTPLGDIIREGGWECLWLLLDLMAAETPFTCGPEACAGGNIRNQRGRGRVLSYEMDALSLTLKGGGYRRRTHAL